MEPNSRNQIPHRWRLTPAGVRPLEIWDLLTSAGALHRCRHFSAYPRLLVESLEAIRGGYARRCDGGRVHVPFKAIVVAGGGLLDPCVRETLQARFAGIVSLHLCPDPMFFAATGVQTILQELGRHVLSADVGQTAIKVVQGESRFLVPRDWIALPLADEVPPEQREHQRAALRSFISSALQLRDTPPAAIVVGLPCDFPADVPGPCSYAGLEGDAHIVEEAIAEAGLADCPCVYLNDAVLAALAARSLLANQLPSPTLVVTLGFGVGGAVLDGDGP